MPVAEATAISFLSPLVTMALSVTFLGEAMTARKIVATVSALVGGILILQPDADGLRPAGLLALASAGLMGVETILIKKLADSEPALQILLISNTIGTVIALSVASFVFVAPTAAQWVALCALGTIMVTGQAFFIQSMKRGDASFVIPAFYSVLVFAALYDLAIFDVVPTTLALLGSAFIVIAALLLSM